jgi:hypothetical protein
MPGSMHGVIRHRLLVNYAADAEVVAQMLPVPLRPQLVRGKAVVGICVLRLAELRPAGVPAWAGIRSDNAAHRMAVEWDGPSGVEVGVYVLRRDSAQCLPVLLGGRAFPGVHGRAAFQVDDEPGRLHVAYRTADDLEVDAVSTAPESWSSRLFADATEASAFFEAGSCGFSPDHRGCLEGISMATDAWRAEPVSITATSSFYDDPTRFPPGTIELDGAMLMRDVPVVWSEIDGPSAPRSELSRAG